MVDFCIILCYRLFVFFQTTYIFSQGLEDFLMGLFNLLFYFIQGLNSPCSFSQRSPEEMFSQYYERWGDLVLQLLHVLQWHQFVIQVWVVSNKHFKFFLRKLRVLNLFQEINLYIFYIPLMVYMQRETFKNHLFVGNKLQ